MYSGNNSFIESINDMKTIKIINRTVLKMSDIFTPNNSCKGRNPVKPVYNSAKSINQSSQGDFSSLDVSFWLSKLMHKAFYNEKMLSLYIFLYIRVGAYLNR